MRGVFAILKKDFASFLHSWTGVFVIFSFLLTSGIFFTLFLLGYSQLSLQAASQAYEGIEELNVTTFVMGAFILNLGVLFLFLEPLSALLGGSLQRYQGTQRAWVFGLMIYIGTT